MPLRWRQTADLNTSASLFSPPLMRSQNNSSSPKRPTLNAYRIVWGRGDFRATRAWQGIAPRRGISRDRSVFPAPVPPRCLQSSFIGRTETLLPAALERELPIKLTSDHGVSLAFYFDDPDGNMIEVYWPTGKHVNQPCLKPLDLSQSDEAILASIATETVLPTEIPF